MLIAYKRKLLGPAWRGKRVSSTKVSDGDLVYYDESWTVGRSMGSHLHKAVRIQRKGFGIERGGNHFIDSNDIADIRIIPHEAAEHITAIDEQIAKLTEQKQRFLDDSFLTFLPPTMADCTRVTKGTGQKEAEARAKEKNKAEPISETTIKAERKIAGEIGRSLSRLK